MRVAITGTPGTGKKAVSSLLISKGYEVLGINEIATTHDFILGYEGKTKIVDLDKLNTFIQDLILKKGKGIMFIKGHLSHLLDVDLVIVLRCEPKELRRRLKQRGYNEEKIQENVESEVIDVITVEAAESCQRVYEIDTSSKRPNKAVEVILKILNNEGEGYKAGGIDWSEEVMEWY